MGEEEQEGLEAGEQGVGGGSPRGAGRIEGGGGIGGEGDPEVAQLWGAFGSWTSKYSCRISYLNSWHCASKLMTEELVPI